MKQVLLLHGLPDRAEFYDPTGPSQSNRHYFPWVQKQLAIRDILCQTPELPRPYDPVYEDWKRVFEQFELSSETIVVGYSCGGGFAVRYFSENREKMPARLILVAPWLDPNKEVITTGMFDFEIDESLSQRIPIDIMYSLDDDSEILTTVNVLKDKLPEMNIHEFTDKGHFTADDIGLEFPELLEIILK